MGPETLDLIQTTLLGEAADHVPIAISVVDGEMRHVAVNRFACRLLGYEREDLIGLTVVEVSPPPRSESLYAELVHQGSLYGTTRGRRRDGTEFDASFTAVRTGNDEERYIGIAEPLGVSVPLLADDSGDSDSGLVDEQRTVLGDTLDRAPIAVFVADEEMHYLAVSRHACELLGYEREELIALGVSDVSPPPASLERYRELMVRGRLSGRAELVRSDGGSVEIEYTAGATRVGEIPLYVSFARAVESLLPATA